jgi:hypothetical protein
MSLYREARSRTGRTVAVLAAVFVVGGIVGAALVYALRPEPTLADRVTQLQEDVRPALDGLELVPIHYESSNATTRRAAADQLAAAQADVNDVASDLQALDPAAAARVDRALEELAALIDDGAPPAQVEQAVAAAERELREAARLD